MTEQKFQLKQRIHYLTYWIIIPLILAVLIAFWAAATKPVSRPTFLTPEEQTKLEEYYQGESPDDYIFPP